MIWNSLSAKRTIKNSFTHSIASAYDDLILSRVVVRTRFLNLGEHRFLLTPFFASSCHDFPKTSDRVPSHWLISNSCKRLCRTTYYERATVSVVAKRERVEGRYSL